MIPLDELPNVEWTDPDSGATNRIYFDLITDETGQFPAVVTQHPVEEGGKVTDHYRKDPIQMRVTCKLAGSPLRGDLDPDNVATSQHHDLLNPKYPPGAPIFTPGGLFQAAEAGISAAVGALGSLVGLGGDTGPTGWDSPGFPDDPRNRFQRVCDTLQDLQARGILVTLHATFGDFESLAITNASPHRDAEAGDSLDIEIDFNEVRFVTSDVNIGAPLPAEPRGLPSKTGTSVGNGAAESGHKESTASKLFDTLTGG